MFGCEATDVVSLFMGVGFSGWPLANPLLSAATTELVRGLLLLFSGTFSFCAVVSTVFVFTAVVAGEDTGADVVVVVVFFCCFFFLLALEVETSLLGAGFEELGVTLDGLVLPPFTVSRDEMSNMVGTERNSCCVIPLLSSSEVGGE